MKPLLVSLIVRSIGRPELFDALAAIAGQDYPAIEVIVIDATGGHHPSTPHNAGPFPVRFASGTVRRSRPEAANAGLDVADGAIVGLLDDDDLIEPTHVAGLVAALASFPTAVAAYSAARELDATGAVVSRRAQAWSRFLLYQDCYICSNSVLFRRDAIGQSRFDVRFGICEDWDFWLQLSEIGDFVHVPAETAVVRVTLGRSGAGHGANRNRARFEYFRRLLAEKWAARGAEIAIELDTAAREAGALVGTGRIEEGQAAAELVLAKYPFHVGALNVCGAALAMRGDLAGAITRFRLAVAEDSQDAASRLNLARALERSGGQGDATIEYRALPSKHPGNTEPLCRLRNFQAPDGSS